MELTLSLTDEEQQALLDMAAKEGVPAPEVTRRAILERAQRTGLETQVHGAGVRAVDRYAALLERLAQ